MDIKKIIDVDEMISILNFFYDVFPNLSNRVSLTDYSKKLVKHASVYAVFFQNEIAGIIAFYVNDKTSNKAFLTLIGVKDKYRHKSIGTELLKICEKEAYNNGMESIELEVRNRRQGAISFYKKMGFTVYKKNDVFSYMRKILETV